MVFEAGVPNRERIVFRPTASVELSGYGVWICLQLADGTVRPITNYSFWFGKVKVDPPSWVVIFTGKGEYRVVEHSETKEPIYCFHWGSEQTLFNHRVVVPVIYRFDSFSIGVQMSPIQETPTGQIRQQSLE